MPLYEYQCSDCGHRLEALQKMSDDRLVYCPECNEPALKKLISAAAFHLKGTGWYETDFKNSGKKPDDKGDGSGKTDSGDKSGKSADGASKSEGSKADSSKSDSKKSSDKSSGSSGSGSKSGDTSAAA